MTARTVYAWQDKDGKFRLSVMKAGQKFRPSNSYDTDVELLRDAEQRGLTIKWEDR